MWKLQKMSRWMHGVSYLPSLEESYLSDAGSMSDNSHFVVFPQSHSSESVPLGWQWCTWPAWPAQSYRDESSLLEQWKNLILVEDLWVSSPLVFHEVGRDTFHDLVLDFIQFLLQPILYLSPPPVGINFSQDQVTWIQWNDISFSIMLPLLSFIPWCGLHLNLFKGFLQPFT